MSHSSNVLERFFAAFGRGDIEGVLATFDPGAQIVAVRRPSGRDLYGTYRGLSGVREFLANLADAFDTKKFAVDFLGGDGDVAFAQGSFEHVVKKTGKTFASDWALMCRTRAGKIVEYRFFEDSAALGQASL